jgi:hypothetical protein
MEDDEESDSDSGSDPWANEELAERRWLYRNFGIDK